MLIDQYAHQITAAIDAIAAGQRDKLLRAAGMVRDVLANDGLIYVFGSGHSHMLAEETFYRAGGLACTAPILYPPLMLHESAAHSSHLERQPGLAREVLKGYDLTPKDMLICISNSGINPVPVELAAQAQAMGVPTMVICSGAYADVPSRCPDGKRLTDNADLWIDNMAPHGDACLQPEGSPVRTTPVSTITGTFILNSILAEGMELALKDGVEVPAYLSANIPGGTERNQTLIDRYAPRIPHL